MRLYSVNDMFGDFYVDFVSLLIGNFRELMSGSLDDKIDVRNVDAIPRTESKRHLLIDFDYYLLGLLYYAPVIGQLRSHIEVSEFIHRRNLKHRDINASGILIPKRRKFRKRHGHVPASSVFRNYAVIAAEVRENESDVVVSFGGLIKSERFFPDCNRTENLDIRKFIGTFRLLEQAETFTKSPQFLRQTILDANNTLRSFRRENSRELL